MLKRIIAIVMLIVILVGYLLLPALAAKSSPTRTRLSPFSDAPDAESWENLTHLKEKLSKLPSVEIMSLVSSPILLRNIENPSRVLYMAIGIEREFRDTEFSVLKEFINRGGQVIVADDYGFGNTISNDFDVQFFGKQLWSELTYKDQNGKSNVSFPVVPARDVFGVKEYRLIADYPTGLQIKINSTYKMRILANATEKSYVDLNGDRKIGIGDKIGNITFAVRVSYGNGNITFIADPGIFINNVLDRKAGAEFGNNWDFIKDYIAATMPLGGKIIFDESRHQLGQMQTNVYRSVETVAFITTVSPESKTLVMQSAMALAGVLMISMVVIIRAKDKENWIHKFDISRIRRRTALPDTRNVQIERLRKAVLSKVRMMHSLSPEELRALTPPQIAEFIRDHQFSELVLSTEPRPYAPEELRMIVNRLRSWGK